MHLVDVFNTDLRQWIERGHGVESVELRAMQGVPPAGSRYARPLSDMQRHIPGADELVVLWRGKERRLDTRAVMDAYEEAENLDFLMGFPSRSRMARKSIWRSILSRRRSSLSTGVGFHA